MKNFFYKVGLWFLVMLVIFLILEFLGLGIADKILSLSLFGFLSVEGVLGFGGMILVWLGTKPSKKIQWNDSTPIEYGLFNTDEEEVVN